MKKYSIFFVLAVMVSGPGCRKLDVPPKSIIQDQDVFGSSQGVLAYMARLYSELPLEDFRYSPQRGLNMFWIISPTPAVTGEALSRDQRVSQTEAVLYWKDAYKLIRETNYFMATLP